MNEKDIADIRRRYRYGKSNISHVRGCFVNENKEIISEFDQGLGLINEEDADQILGVMKKTLSGTLGRNLLEVDFSTQQVMESEEHRLLSELRSTELKDEACVRALYEKIVSSLEIEGNYVILLAHDRYDVYSYSADGEKEESTESFSYILCSICPIKSGKPSLSFYLPSKCFRTICADTLLSAPSLGFMFPAYEDGGANLYRALYYTKDLQNNHEELSAALFSSELPMPAAAQRETFGSVLERAMQEDCSLRVVRSVHHQVRQLMEEHKEEKSEEPLVITKETVAEMLRYTGVPEERVTAFEEKYEEEFGERAELTPKNLVENNRFQIQTPEVKIQVSAEHSDLVETRVIDGVRYILIRADHEVQINGVNVQID